MDKDKTSQVPEASEVAEVSQEPQALPGGGQSRAILRFFFFVIVISAAVSTLVVSFVKRSDEPSDEELPHGRLTWFTGEKAAEPFEKLWQQARLISFEQLESFAHDLSKLIEEEGEAEYQPVQSKDERRTALVKTYFGDNDYVAVEIPYFRLVHAAQLLDKNQLAVPISETARDLADGGLAEFNFTFVLSVDPAIVRENLFIKIKKGVDPEVFADEPVRILFTATAAETDASSEMVRPMKVASKRSTPDITTRNEWVRHRTDSGRLFAELEGAMLSAAGKDRVILKGLLYRD